MELLEPLPNGKFRVIDTNKLLMKHNQELESLRKENKALKNTVEAFENRLEFTEQAAREAIAYVKSDPYVKSKDAAEKALQEALKLGKFANYLLVELGKREAKIKGCNAP